MIYIIYFAVILIFLFIIYLAVKAVSSGIDAKNNIRKTEEKKLNIKENNIDHYK
tara:strand:+ start:606 stop:767 length:162 start_codon:yes stop_codon:yes gene_type:complete